ncbi:MAG: VWA domain-containing protein [Bdellovibrionales bacterium]|nr:VWA domain-containing protein [Bdellovibrionales bacterium]
MKKEMKFLGLMLMTVLVLGACAEYDYFNRVLKRTSQNTPQDQTETPTDAPDGAADPNLDYFTVTNSWTQPTDLGAIAKPEIIFVVDTSGSMGDELDAIKDSLTGWVNQLTSQNVNDFCLGVIRANTNSSQRGALLAGSHGKKCICTYGDNEVSHATAVTEFSQTLDAALGSSGGQEKEAGIYSAHQAFTNASKLEQNQEAGCFRDDATAVMFLVSDENDSGYSPDNGSNVFDNTFFLGNENFSTSYNDPYYQGQDHEADVRRDYYTDGVKYAADGVTPDAGGKYFNNLTHETLIDEMLLYNGDLPTWGTALGYLPGDLPAASSQAGPFWGGIQYAEEFEAEFVNMKDITEDNQAAFQSKMNAMADELVQQLSYYDTFTLSDTICDVDQDDSYSDESITVKVNGSTVNPSNYSIISSGRKVRFVSNYSWASGATVEVTYLRCE